MDTDAAAVPAAAAESAAPAVPSANEAPRASVRERMMKAADDVKQVMIDEAKFEV